MDELCRSQQSVDGIECIRDDFTVLFSYAHLYLFSVGFFSSSSTYFSGVSYHMYYTCFGDDDRGPCGSERGIVQCVTALRTQILLDILRL